MAKYENPAELDYRNGGDTVDDFAQKYMRTVDYIIKALNDLRTPTGNTAGVEPEPYMWRIADNKLYIRNADNTDYILLGDISPNFGFRQSVNDRFLTTADLEGEGAVVTRNEAGKVEGDITGSPGKIANKTIDVTPSADNDVIAYDATQQKWVKKTLNDYLKKQGDAGWDEMVDEVADQVIEDITPIIFNFWYLDDDGYLVPLVGSTEGGLPSIHGMVGDYEQITARSVDVAGNLSATGNVTAGMVTTPQANVTTLTANAVNAQSASVTEISAGTITADDIIAKGPIVDVRAFGVVGDGITDIYDKMFDLLHAYGENHTIFFPAGTYNVSDTLFIPSNCTIIGEGKSTVINFVGPYGIYGPAIMTAGDNISINNLRIEHINTTESTEIIPGSNYGGIGVSPYDFSTWTSKHQAGGITFQHNKNIIIKNIYSESNNVLACEGATIDGVKYGVTDIIWENIYAPNSAVRFGGGSQGYINNITMRNIIACALGNIGGADNDIAIYDNIRCNNLHLAGSLSVVNNSVIDVSKYDNLKSGTYNESCFVGSAIVKMTNVSFVGNNNKYTRYVTMGSGDAYLDTVNCDSSLPFIAINTPTIGSLNCVNCDLQNSTINIKKGNFVNCNANIIYNSDTVNLNGIAEIIKLNWEKETVTFNQNITERKLVKAGTYIIEVQIPTSDSTLKALAIRSIDGITISAASNTHESFLINLETNQQLALYSLTGQTINFSNITNGYVKLVRIK